VTTQQRLISAQRGVMCRVAGVLLLSASASACSIVNLTANDKAEDELREQKAQWAAQPNMTQYLFNLQVICFCPEVRPVRVRVVSGAVVSATDRTSGEALPAASLARLYSVEGLFALIQGAIDRGADKLTVTYDPVLHYPTRIDIDYIRNAIDDELGVVASDLVRSGSGSNGFNAGARTTVPNVSP
jgi:hypothetical protein